MVVLTKFSFYIAKINEKNKLYDVQIIVLMNHLDYYINSN